ncbi:MAG: homocysteine S-methyltransferase family protein, partial [Treponema sp.]|nr:homocysteine S-methyltransferase family protein [Treponema sp.]
RGERFARHTTNLKGCNDILCLTKPEVISGIHEAYLEAGADIIETCSLNATTVSLKDYGLEDLAREMSRAAASIARKAADKFSTPEKPRFVAGSIGPTAKSAFFTQDIDHPEKRQISWDELDAAYYENARGLIEGGADFLLIETVYDSLNAKAALFAINRLSAELGRDIPAMVSATVSESGRMLTGQTSEAFCASMMHSDPLALGLNCSFGAEALKAPLQKLSAFAPCPVLFYPNAGLPDRQGVYSDTSEIMARAAEACMKDGLINIIGGCCGSTPAHIAAIAEAAKNYKPRLIPDQYKKTILSGTQVLKIEKETIANSLNTAFPWQSALDSGNYEEAVEIARDYNKELYILPICPDKAPDPLAALKGFIFQASAFSELAELPILIESSHWDVIEAGLKCLHGRGAVRYIASEETCREKTEIIRAYGAILIS